ncbi:hypothetical protein PIB30_029265 [Stylosanthes scabra]|uniref:RNase H type-1 domain-containing protein n=1 Tax=Stylosanthes scabra TaxID=79078 RepID=A0ABU6UA01_9FABA|nr:hypothetical protein [Stylosanthes scabra]
MSNIKCNIDGAYCKTTGSGATTTVFRDSSGRMITYTTSNVEANTALTVEALAIRNARGEPTCQHLKSNLRIAAVLPIWNDINKLMQSQGRIGFTWIPREGNELAH